MDSIKEKLKKIHTLSVEGATEGEKKSAQRQLENLLFKYHLTLSDIVDEARSKYSFKFRNNTEKRLLVQIVCKVLDSTDFDIFGRYGKERWFNLTKAEYVEVSFLFDEYKRAYKKELEVFFQAFIQTNRLFASRKDEGAETEDSDKDYSHTLKVLQMAAGMDKVEVSRKRLESGKTNA